MAEKNKRDIGKEGEDIAAKYLTEKGFEILERKPKIISNPSTRETMKIYPKKTVKFRISKNIKKWTFMLIGGIGVLFSVYVIIFGSPYIYTVAILFISSVYVPSGLYT